MQCKKVTIQRAWTRELPGFSFFLKLTCIFIWVRYTFNVNKNIQANSYFFFFFSNNLRRLIFAL